MCRGYCSRCDPVAIFLRRSPNTGFSLLLVYYANRLCYFQQV